MASDNDDDKDDGDDGANSKDVEVVEIGTGGALTMLDRLINLKYLSKEERNPRVAMKDKLQKIRLWTKKQSHIDVYFMLEESFYDRFINWYFVFQQFKLQQFNISFFSLSKVTPMSCTCLDYLKYRYKSNVK